MGTKGIPQYAHQDPEPMGTTLRMVCVREAAGGNDQRKLSGHLSRLKASAPAIKNCPHRLKLRAVTMSPPAAAVDDILLAVHMGGDLVAFSCYT